MPTLILAQQQPEMIAYWRFDEGSGSMAADTAHPGESRFNPDTGAWQMTYGRYPGTITGAQWSAAWIGQSALSFDGHSKVVTPAIPLTNRWTISAWVSISKEAVATQYAYLRIAETAYDAGFFLGTDHTGRHYKLMVNSGAGSTGACGWPFGCAAGGELKAGAWQLITGTSDGAVARLYVDGVQVASDTLVARPSSSLPLSIGEYSYYPNAGYGWRGSIDDVRLFDRPLTAAEIAEIYNQSAGARKLAPVLIESMACKESAFLGQGTRAVTCAMKARNQAWTGTLQLKLDNPSHPEQPPLNWGWPVLMQLDGRYAVTGIALYDRAGTSPRILGADFYGKTPAAIWEHHPQCEPNCKATLVSPLDFPCPAEVPCASGLYPPPVMITELRCETAAIDPEWASVTCGIAANQNAYSGTLRVSFDDNTVDDQRVYVEQPTIDNQLVHWGVVAVAVTAAKLIVNVEFIAESPIANWTPEKTTPYPPPGGKKTGSIWCRWFGWGCKSSAHVAPLEGDIYIPTPPAYPPPPKPPEAVAYEKVYFRNRFCDPDSCLRPPG